MKNKLITIGAVFFMAHLAFAQAPAIVKGDQIINAGLGFGSTGYRGTGYSVTMPPLSVSYEKILWDQIANKGFIGLGGYLGFASYKYDFSLMGRSYGWDSSNFILGARGSFHYPLLDKLDSYTGVMLGYEIVSVNETGTFAGTSAAASGVVLSWYLGGRYFFTEKFAGMLELGYGISYLNLGIALKL